MENIDESNISSADDSSKKKQQPSILKKKELEIDQLKKIIKYKDAELDVIKYQSAAKETISVSKPTFFMLILVIACLGVMVVYSFIYKENNDYNYISTFKDSALYGDSSILSDTGDVLQKKINEVLKEGISITTTNISKGKPVKTNIKPKKKFSKVAKISKKANKPVSKPNLKPKPKQSSKEYLSKIKNLTAEEGYDTTNFDPPPRYDKYKIATYKAYLYDKPDVRTRGIYYMNRSYISELSALEEKNDFIYVEFLNTEGQISKGWLHKTDLKQL